MGRLGLQVEVVFLSGRICHVMLVRVGTIIPMYWLPLDGILVQWDDLGSVVLGRLWYSEEIHAYWQVHQPACLVG